MTPSTPEDANLLATDSFQSTERKSPEASCLPAMTMSTTQTTTTSALMQENEHLRAELEAVQQALDAMTEDIMSVRSELEAVRPAQSTGGAAGDHSQLEGQALELRKAKRRITDLQATLSARDDEISQLKSDLAAPSTPADAVSYDKSPMSTSRHEQNEEVLQRKSTEKDREVAQLQTTLDLMEIESKEARIEVMRQLEETEAITTDDERESLQQQVIFFKNKVEEVSLWAQSEIEWRRRLESDLSVKQAQLDGEVSLTRDLQEQLKRLSPA